MRQNEILNGKNETEETVPGIDQHLTDLEKKDKIVMMIFL